MIYSKHRNLIRWIIIIASFAIISLILWNTYIFFQNFKAEERTKMQNWSFAQKELNDTSNLGGNISELPLQIQQNNTTTPMILVNGDGIIQSYINIDEKKAENQDYLNKLILKFEEENKPIEVRYQNKILSTIYYGNTPLLNKKLGLEQ